MFLHSIIAWVAKKLEKKGIVEDMKEFNNTRVPKLLRDLQSELSFGRGTVAFYHRLSKDGKRCYIIPQLTNVRLRDGIGMSRIDGGRIVVHDPRISDEKLLKKMVNSVGDLMLHEYVETLYYKRERIFDPHDKYEVNNSTTFWKRGKKEDPKQQEKEDECTCGLHNGLWRYAYKLGGVKLGILVLLTAPLWYPFYWIMPKKHAPDCSL